MKAILSILLLACLTLAAEPLPASGQESAQPTAVQSTNAPAANPEAVPLPRLGGRRSLLTNAPNGSARSAAPAPGVIQPVAPPGAVPPPGIGVPAGAVNPGPAGPASTPAGAAAKPLAGVADDTVFQPKWFSYSGADLSMVLQRYGELVGRNMLRSPTVETALKAQVFFVNQTPLTREEAIQAHKAIFAMNNVALVEVDEKFLKVVTTTEAPGSAQKPVITTNATDLAELGQYVTYTLQLKYVKPSEMVQLLTSFQSGKIANAVWGIDATSTLVLRDMTENVKRMLELIAQVDIGGISEFTSEVIPIKFAKAEEIAQALSSLSGSSSTATVGQRSTGGAGTGATGVGNRPGVGGYNQTMPGQMTTPGQIGTGTPSAGSSFSGRINQIIANASRMSASGSGDFQIIGPNKIVADVRANALVVFASKHDIEIIKDIISKLDVILAQVVIETVILDVTTDNTFAFSLSGVQTPKDFTDNFTGAGGLNGRGLPGFFSGGAGANTNAFTDLIGTGLRYFGKVDDNWYIQLQAAATQGKVNVIQKPRIQTSHAKAARIFIGGTVPYVQSTYYGGSYVGGPSSSYQQLPVGIGLQVTPFINSDGLVVLQIDDFSIDEISGSTEIAGVGQVPNTTKRQLLGEIAVMDGETIMLGGFVRNYEQKSRSGVPILKDIPLLGPLFSSRGTDRQRAELLVVMKPTVLRTPEMAAAHVAKERQTMPGVIKADQDMQELEQNALEETRKELEKQKRQRSKKSPSFTEEEPPLSGTP